MLQKLQFRSFFIAHSVVVVWREVTVVVVEDERQLCVYGQLACSDSGWQGVADGTEQQQRGYFLLRRISEILGARIL